MTCQGSAACDLLEERKAELLPVPDFHVVLTLRGPIADLASTTTPSSSTSCARLRLRRPDHRRRPKAARRKENGITSVLHTWGPASCRRRASGTMTHNPHVHIIVPGGGLSADRSKWIACRPNFFLPVRVLSRIFRRLVIEMLLAAHTAGQPNFVGETAGLADVDKFADFLTRVKQ
jgi:Putative transposase